MLDSIYIGMTGLMGYSRGLKIISNNVANMNTPGFKASQLQFANLFYANDQSGGQGVPMSYGQSGLGLNTLNTTLNFKQGEFRQTGNSLDLALNGNGFFVLRALDGTLSYTRAGQFDFDADGFLVNRTDGLRVMALDGRGQLTDVTLTGLKTNPAKATDTITFQGNLSNDDTDHVIDGVKVFDSVGGEHTLKLTFTNNAPATPGHWTVTVTDGGTTVATGNIAFINGAPDPAASSLSFSYAPSGVAAIPLTFDFKTDVTSFAAGTTSSLAVNKVSGYGIGALTDVTVNENGQLKLTYSNGQTALGSRLAIARFDTEQSLEGLGGNQFKSKDDSTRHLGTAGGAGIGAVSSGLVELSNVDLSQEFGDLIVTQRGYQASSQIISTANDMIQQLMDMKSRR
jgi:flagellar hook protein FlgE